MLFQLSGEQGLPNVEDPTACYAETVDRESRMTELDKQINELCDRPGLSRRYLIASEQLDAEERP